MVWFGPDRCTGSSGRVFGGLSSLGARRLDRDDGVLTDIVSNNAAAVIGTPIAITVADALGAPPEAFVLGVLFGANLSFVTPMAYQTNLLVMNATGYIFSDFVRVGLPLALLMWAGFSLVLSVLYKLI